MSAYDFIPNENSYEIVSKVAYLIGVPTRIFDNEYEPPKRAIYDKLKVNKNCRIVRNLMAVRTALARANSKLYQAVTTDVYSVSTLLSKLPYLEDNVMRELSEDGIRFSAEAERELNKYCAEVNKYISDRINNCRSVFPSWLNWDYLRALFVDPAWLHVNGVKKAAVAYYGVMNQLPYQMYINWVPLEDEGNLLHYDAKFVKRLYQANNDYFYDRAKVSDCSEQVKSTIYDFLDASERAVLLVDCENSDPYKLVATLNGLKQEQVNKIRKIILVNDVNTASAWEIISNHISVPVEAILVQRLKQEKSLVDMTLALKVSQEYYQNKADSFVICSSDSDYWTLVQNLPMVNFFFMVQRDRFGHSMMEHLNMEGIHYCFIEDFYAGNSTALETEAVLREVSKSLVGALSLNLNEVLAGALEKTRLHFNQKEYQHFFQKYLKTVRLAIDENGAVKIELKGFA